MVWRIAAIVVSLAILVGIGLAVEPSPALPTIGNPAAVVVHPFDSAELQQFEWGWIRWIINAKVEAKAPMTLGIVHVEAKQTNPVHIHPNSDEYLHVLVGSCEHRVGDEWVALKAGDTIRIPRNAPHGIRTGKEACRSMIVYDTGDRQMVVVDGEQKK